MNIFISWSGERSRLTAELVKTWIKYVIQSTKPWISTTDIERGALWQAEIGAQLQDSTHGIICLTRENKAAPWVLFEAGALAKGLETSRIYTLLIDLEPNEVTGPLAQFNHTKCTEDDMYKLVRSINLHSELPLENDLLKASFKAHWSMFEDGLAAIQARTADQQPAEPPTNLDMSREILSSLRNIQARLTDLEMAQPDSDPSNPYVLPRRVVEATIGTSRSRSHGFTLPPLPTRAGANGDDTP